MITYYVRPGHSVCIFLKYARKFIAILGKINWKGIPIVC